jgi:outer membrane receptor for ferrienterochelin and colicin
MTSSDWASAIAVLIAGVGWAGMSWADSDGAAPASQVQGVVVIARKPKVETLIDRTVYDVKTDLQSKTGTAVDVLQNVPSVEVDADGNVSLRGDPNVTILIDGKPSAQFAGGNAGLGLQELPASDIERIEVMTNPPAQYKAEGSAGVINIITRKSRPPGVAGVLQANYGDDGRYNASGNMTYASGPLTLTAGLSLRKDFRRRIITDARSAIDPASGQLEASRETLNEGLRRTYGQAKAGMDYALTPRTTVGASIRHQEAEGPRDFLQTDASATAAGVPLSASERVSQGYEWDKNAGEEAHLEQKLGRADETLTLSFKRTVTNERERYRLDDTHILPVSPPDEQHLHLTENLAVDEVSVEYARPMSHGRDLRLGYDFEDDRYQFHDFGDTVDPSTGGLIPNPLVTFDFRFHQQIHTGYGEVETPIGRGSAQAGLRLEQTRYTADLGLGAAASAKSYFRAYPSLHVEWPLTASAKLVFSAARRINRPDPGALNPFIDYQDIYNLRAGNADLLPEDVWSYEAGWQYDRKGVSASATGYYRFSRDAVTDIVRPVSGNVVLDTKTNLPKSRSGGLELTAAAPIIRGLTVNFSGNLFYNQIDATALGLPGLRSTVGFNAKASLEWRPTLADTFQATFSRSDRRLTPQGYIGAINLVNFGYRRQVTPGLAIIVTLSDAFNGQRSRRFVLSPVLDDAYQRYQVGQVAYVGFVYSFGGTKKGKPADIQFDQPS